MDFDWSKLDTSNLLNNNNTLQINNETQEEKEKKDLINNYAKAYEIIPESFIPVDMIYIPCSIGNKYIPAFVDTGAQINIMNIETAVKCGLGPLINKDIETEMVGVGKQTSLGKIFYVEVTIGTNIIPCSFTISHGGPSIIIGLNTLLRHQCILDLGKKSLIIGNDTIHFLQEKNLPKSFT